jgi:mono/diheme cytochrome c family protein
MTMAASNNESDVSRPVIARSRKGERKPGATRPRRHFSKRAALYHAIASRAGHQVHGRSPDFPHVGKFPAAGDPAHRSQSERFRVICADSRAARLLLQRRIGGQDNRRRHPFSACRPDHGRNSPYEGRLMTHSAFAIAFAGVLIAGSPIAAAAADKAEQGAALFTSQKCSMCHSIAGKGNAKGSLDGVGAKLKDDEIKMWITDPEGMRAKTNTTRTPAMKAMKLSGDQVDALVAYLSSQKAK